MSACCHKAASTQHSNPQAQMITEVSSEQSKEKLPETWWS